VNDALESGDDFRAIHFAALELKPQVEGFCRWPVLENKAFGRPIRGTVAATV
jgi:hypothetical protein